MLKQNERVSYNHRKRTNATTVVCYTSITVKSTVAQDEHVGHFNFKCNSKLRKISRCASRSPNDKEIGNCEELREKPVGRLSAVCWLTVGRLSAMLSYCR